MKNKISFLIILALLAVIVLAFSACGETPQGTDTGVGEGIPTEYVIETADGFEIDVETNKIFKTVSNSIENIDLSNSFNVTDGATWKLYKDFLGEEEYKLKSMSLSIGENKAYIVVYHPNGESFTRYELSLYRLDMKEYSFIVDGEVYQNGTAEESSIIEAPATNPQKTGYDFLCWTVNDKEASFPYCVLYNVELVACFAPIEYEINYELNGGANGENPSKYTIEEAISLVNPTRAFYEFCGWYENAEFEGEAVADIEIGTYGEKTYCAKWSPITYDINYELNGGTNNEKNPNSYNAETSVELKAPTKDGHTFDGWFTDEDFENQINGISIGEGNEKTFYAKWTANENTIVFNANGGTGTMQNMTVATDVSANLTSNAFTKEGYTFKGWATSENGSVAYTNGASYTMGTNSSYTLYAVWEANKNILVFNSNGGSGSMQSMTIATDSTAKLTSNAFAKAGYTFMGWSSTENGEVEYADGANYTMGKNSSYTLYAVWQVNINGVIFNANGGKGTMSSLELATGATSVLPSNTFTKAGYTFKGWSTSVNGSVAYADGASYTMGANSTYTLYAIWEANNNTVVFNGNGATSGSMFSIVKKTGETIVLPNNEFSKDGYTFKGWSTSTSGNIEYANGASYLMGTDSSYTLYAIWEANKNTLVFNSNGGAGIMQDMTIATNTSTNLALNTYTKEGYTFKGWSTSVNGSVAYTDGASYTMGANSTYMLYAVWQANENIIVFIGNGATGGTMANMTLPTNSTANLTINAYTKNGCNFIGWATSPNGGVVYVDGASYTMGTNSIYTLYAVWESYLVTVEFDSNGGSAVESQKVELNKKVKEPSTPTREGYTFEGWYLGNDKWSFIGYVVTEDMKLVAKWTPNNNTIVFDANGGSGTMSNVTIETNASANLVSNTYTKAGYTFIGWATSADGSVEYSDGDSYTMGTESSYTLYAVWQANENIIVFKANGGIGSMESMTATTDSTVNLTANAFERKGYTFKGWATYSYGSATYEDCATYTMGTNSSYILYAVWEANQNTLVFDANGGEGTMSDMLIATDSTVYLTASSFTKEYYTFMGWSTTKDGTVEYTDGSKYPMGADSSYTLYAVWKLTDYGITYVLNGGANGQNPDTYTVEQEIVLKDPSKIGYTFMGWYSDSAFENAVTNIALGTSGEKVFYAKWEIIEYTVTYNMDGGTETTANPTTFTVEDLPITLNDLNNKTDYLFDYWYKESDFSGTPITQITSVGDIELYACYVSGTEGLTFSNSNGAWSISGYTGNSTNVIIPSQYKGKKVTSIGRSAFYKCTSLTSVTISDSTTSIGDRAFSDCTSLTSINYLGTIEQWCNIKFDSFYANPLTYASKFYLNGEEIKGDIVIPNGVTKIPNSAFLNCTQITSVTIPDSVSSIGNSAFSKCTKITSVTIGDGVTSIGSSAFSGCTLLTSVTIPNSVTSIGSIAFNNCTSLTSVTIGDSVTSIGSSAFDNCTSLTSVNYLGTIEQWCNIKFDSSYANPLTYASKFYLNGEEIKGDIVIPNGVTKITDSAFRKCTKITSVTIPDSVTSIGSSAFSGCTSLASVTIPNSVTSIGSSAFSGCTLLTSVTIGDSVTSIGSSAFSGCRSLASVTIGNGVTSIGSNAFSGCFGLTEINFNATAMDDLGDYSVFSNAGEDGDGIKVTVGKEVTKIPACLFKSDYFEYSSKIISVEFEEGSVCESIGSSAFWYCTSLTSVTIPDNVTSIGYGAFCFCTSLTSVTIPNSVTSIGNSVFGKCTSLTSIEVDVNNTAYKSIDGNLYSKDGTTIIIYARGKTDTSFVIPNSVTSIGSSAFSGCTSLASVTIPNSVTSIGSDAFSGCTSLTSVTISDSVISIGNYAFSGCSKLTSVTIPDSATSIGNYAFRYCSSLTSIVIPDSVTSIGNSAFSGCSKLTIYCEATSKPSEWNSKWNYSNRPVVWGHTHSYTDGKCICGVKQN